MHSVSSIEAVAAPYFELLKSLHSGIEAVIWLPADRTPLEAAPLQLLLPLSIQGTLSAGSLLLKLVEGADPTHVQEQIRPALNCLLGSLANVESQLKAADLRLLRLANELDIDFQDDARLEKALGAIARRTGVELAWLAAPRCQLTLAVRGHDHELDAGVKKELAGLRARVIALTGKLRRPMIINGGSGAGARAAECHLLFVPLFVGRGRHNAWLVLANPLAAPAFGGWHTLAALSMGQALTRRLEMDLDRRTGLFNRGGLEASVQRQKLRDGALLMLDIDRLESVNRMHGMASGDAAIMSLARMLAPPLLPPRAQVARTMGDQFAIALPGFDAEQAAALAGRIQAAAAAIQPGLPDDASPLTLTGGVVEVDDFQKPFERFAIDAETALKLAKDRGRMRVETFNASSSTLIRRNDEILAASDLRDAIRNGALLLFAQPIRVLADRTAPPGFELLVRIRDESGEIRSPGEFIGAAQRFQLLTELDRHVVEGALRALSPHRPLLARLSTSVSINVSGQSMADQGFIEHFIGRLQESRVPPGLVTVELTEQAAVTNMARADANLRRLRELGCGIAIDDFGTGANSLAYLRTLPVTRIKIDGSFVRDMLTNKRSESGIRGIMQLAREYQLDTVAEYVETEAIAARLQALGVLRGQGYLFGKPVPLEHALEALAEEERAGARDLLQSF